MDIFAEIEIAAPPQEPKKTPTNTTDSGFETNTETLPIGNRNIPPGGGRQKFYDMRSMAADNPYTWNDARLFYRQAKFMERFTDDFDGNADFSMHTPCLQRMGYERLRTYFTWRTKIRNGEYPEISPAYIFLHMYELLACIGAENPQNALAQLLALRAAYAEKFPALDDYLPSWLKDFHVYYELPHTFADFVRENALLYPASPAFFDSGDILEWSKVSAYDVEKSRFFAANDENAQAPSGNTFRMRGIVPCASPASEKFFPR